MTLASLGWRDFFARQFSAFPNCIPGRICLAERGRFRLWTESGVYDAAPSGNLRASTTIWPVTGDWVAYHPSGSIEAILNRETVLQRKQPGKPSGEQVLAANLDVLFIVTSLDHDFNLRRLERYLILARQGGIRPVVVLNKADLHPDPASIVAEVRTLDPDLPILTMSAKIDQGLEPLHTFCAPGHTAALAGSSGVGKSTIVNQLMGSALQHTQSVREHDSRGLHTTTHRELFQLPQGWLLMDLPGIRELQLQSTTTSIESVFEDVLIAALDCRFRDCRHQNEPGCAVAKSIPPERLASFLKLRTEVESATKETSLAAALLEKKRLKAIHKAMRNHPDDDEE
jgi:ribosome biogenesis GTPase